MTPTTNSEIRCLICTAEIPTADQLAQHLEEIHNLSARATERTLTQLHLIGKLSQPVVVVPAPAN